MDIPFNAICTCKEVDYGGGYSNPYPLKSTKHAPFTIV